MALDLYAGERREQIKPEDEHILQLAAAESACYPQLSALWKAFYDSPRISAQQAGQLVHEFLVILTRPEVESNFAVVKRGLRLAAFFSAAHRDALDVRSHSD